MEENNIVQELQGGIELQGGKYRIVRKLGQGGFGITYEGVQTGLERPVAIKEFFMKDYCNRDTATSHVSIGSEGSTQLVETFRKKFLKEAHFIAQLDNVPHIIRIYDVFEENGTAYYVMEYLDGGSLKQKVARDGALSEEQALTYISQLGQALSALHQNNILHLDVKPDNVLLNGRGEAVLIDFGISKRYDKTGSQTSSTPVGLSKGYAPSEQYQDGGVDLFTPATDIYSLGATLFYLLVGHTPPDANEVLENGLPPCPARVHPELWKAIEQAMQPRKKDRPQTVEAFLSMLNSDDNATKPVTAPAPTVSVVTPTYEPTEVRVNNDEIVEKTDEEDYEDDDDEGSSSWLKWLLIALVVAALAAVLFLFVLPGDKSHKKDKADDDEELYLDDEEDADEDMDALYEDSLRALREEEALRREAVDSVAIPAPSSRPERVNDDAQQSRPDRRADAAPRQTEQQPLTQWPKEDEMDDTPLQAPATQQANNNNTVFEVVEQMPTFPGGDPRIWVGNNIHYPPVAEENGVQGTVVCSFVVETDGSISNVSVVRGVDPSLDKEAVRVIKSMPRWNPGKQEGRPVRVKYTMPLKFQLQ